MQHMLAAVAVAVFFCFCVTQVQSDCVRLDDSYDPPRLVPKYPGTICMPKYNQQRMLIWFFTQIGLSVAKAQTHVYSLTDAALRSQTTAAADALSKQAIANWMISEYYISLVSVQLSEPFTC